MRQTRLPQPPQACQGVCGGSAGGLQLFHRGEAEAGGDIPGELHRLPRPHQCRSERASIPSGALAAGSSGAHPKGRAKSVRGQGDKGGAATVPLGRAPRPDAQAHVGRPRRCHLAAVLRDIRSEGRSHAHGETHGRGASPRRDLIRETLRSEQLCGHAPSAGGRGIPRAPTGDQRVGRLAQTPQGPQGGALRPGRPDYCPNPEGRAYGARNEPRGKGG
mmetsp:Transcript_44839/g.106864  ORF Transcript_44839/g.106864 Transcript_44839/m.106864 type:complete len:218 (-) Transcript_44839:175-828(-)